MVLFTELEQKNLTICMETQRAPNSQSNLEKEEWNLLKESTFQRNPRGINLPDFRLYYKAIVINRE